MKLGCSTLLYGGYDLDTAIEGFKTAGFEAVELASIPGMGEHFKGGQPASEYAEIRAKLDDAGLYLESVGCSGALGTDRFVPLMQAAAALGAPYMTLGTGGLSDDEQAWKQMMDLTRSALPVCESTGVKLSVKPHVRAAVYSIATATRFMNELQSEWVGLNIDNTHLQRVGDDPIAAISALKQWIFTARIRDYDSDDYGIGPIENQIPGKGRADVRGYLQALSTVPGLEYVVVEMVGAKEFELKEIQRIIGETIIALKSYQ
ncbi:MAG: sugar phosphate isomerase/epimerase [Armatimonadia bacterium]